MKRSGVSLAVLLALAPAHRAAAQPAPTSPPDASLPPSPPPAATPVPLVPPGSPVPPVPPVPNDELAGPVERDFAQPTFRRRSIRFAPSYEPVASLSLSTPPPSYTTRWTAYQGDQAQKLDPREFYLAVGHPELADSYQQRHKVMIASYLVFGAGALATGLLLYESYGREPTDCPSGLPSDDFSMCQHQNIEDNNHRRATYVPFLVGTALTSVITFFLGTYLYYHVQPINEVEARSLADGYNLRLRRELRLPEARHAPRLRDLQLAPYVATGAGTGLALGARF